MEAAVERDTAATDQARRRLDSLEDEETEPAAPLPRSGSEGSLLDDLSDWWRELDMEAWVKEALDDIDALLSGAKTLKSVALMPGAEWQPDDARGTCNLCDNGFSFTRRRHHCRHCGLLFCSDCADHFMYLTQNKVRFKFRICSDCKDDEQTADNIRDNGASAVAGVTQVAQAMGREAKKQKEAGNDVNLPSTTKLMEALGMEEGEELTFAHGKDPGGVGGVETSAALLATPDDPWQGQAWWQDDGTEADPFSASGGVDAGESEPWWEDTFFDGSFSGGGGGAGGGAAGDSALSAPSISSEHLLGHGQERFLSYNDFRPDAEPEPEEEGPLRVGGGSPESGAAVGVVGLGGDGGGSDDLRELLHVGRVAAAAALPEPIE